MGASLNSEHSGLFWPYIPHLTLESRTIFFPWNPYSSWNLLSRFHNFYQLVRPIGVRFNQFIELACMEHWFWWFWSPIPTWLGPISSRLVLGYIGFLAAYHESIWILGGEASWKLKGVSLHGELVRRVIGECGFEVEGLFSRVECMGKWMEVGGTKGSDIKPKEGKKRRTSL